MAEAPPILVKFDGKAFLPANAPMAKRCAEFFEADSTYRLEFREDRSAASHRFYFASVNEAFKNIPEQFQVENGISTADDLRREALIRSGYADKVDIIGDNADAARALVSHIRREGGYAIMRSKGNVHRIWVAKSQSMKAMDHQTFEQSKTAVLNEIANLIGVTPAQLAANAQHDDQTELPRNPIGEAAGEPSVGPPQTTERPKPTRLRPPETSPAEKLTGAGEPPPSSQAGGSTPDAAPPSVATNRDIRPEQKPRDGGEPLPKTYNEYLTYLKSWLGFVKSRERITARFAKERTAIWPTLNPRLTTGQEAFFVTLARDAVNNLD